MLSTPTFLSDIMYAPHCIPIWNHKLFVVTCNTLDTAVPQRNKACNILFGKYLLFSSGKPTQCNKYTYNRLSKWHWKCSCTNNSQLGLLLGIPHTIADPSLKTNLKSLARFHVVFPNCTQHWVLFYQSLCMVLHVTSVCKSACFHHRNIYLAPFANNSIWTCCRS